MIIPIPTVEEPDLVPNSPTRKVQNPQQVVDDVAQCEVMDRSGSGGRGRKACFAGGQETLHSRGRATVGYG